MKKSLSAVLAAALTFSAFGSAFAADATTPIEKFNYLKEKGVFEGKGASGEAALEDNIRRDEMARISALLKGLDLNNPPAEATFADVPVGNWAFEEVEAANADKIMEGTGNGFQPAGEVTFEQIARIMVSILGLEVKEDAEVSGNVSSWATGYVAAAIEAGLIEEQADYTVPATRADLINSSYSTYQVQNPEAPEYAVQAVGAKKLQVTFSKAVDKDSVEFTVKKGVGNASVKEITFSEDNKTATIELVAKLVKGTYTVTAKGAAAEELSASVTVEDETVSSVEIVGDVAPLDRNNDKVITAQLLVENQYGEDITKAQRGNLQIYATKAASYGGTGNTVTVNAYDDYYVGETVYFSVTHIGTGKNATKQLKVDLPARAAKIEVEKVYHANNKELTSASNLSEYYLVFNAKDQYGNDFDNISYIADDLQVYSDNPSILNVGNFTTLTVDEEQRNVLQLANPTSSVRFDGTANVTFVHKHVGGASQYAVEVAPAAKLEALTIEGADVIVAGEENELAFSAVDQFGNEITDEDDIEAGLSNLVASGVSGLNIEFKTDYETGKAKLVLDASSAPALERAVQITVTATTATYKPVFATLTLQPQAEVEGIYGTKDFNRAIAIGATAEFDADNIQVSDQYGRIKTAADFGLTPVVTSNNGNVTVGTGNVTAAVKGSSTINVQLKDGATLLENISYDFTVRAVAVDEIVDYAVGSVDPLYTGGVTYKKKLKVEGLLNDDTKVTLPVDDTNYYTVTDQTYIDTGLVYNAGHFHAESTMAADIDKEKKYTVVVTGKVKDGGLVTHNVELTVTEAAPVATKYELRDGSGATKDTDGVVVISEATINGLTERTLANAVVKVVDQYGVEITSASKFRTVTTSKSFASAVAGDEITVAVQAQNGSTFSFKVAVE
ncbi:S-layer-like y domain-containing protein [Marinicrinis lubricantis]